MMKKQEDRFVYREGGRLNFRTPVFIDTITGVQYLFAHMGDVGGITVLVDENGKPLVCKELKKQGDV